MAQILTGTRKYRFGLVLGHQELRQLQRNGEVASAVLGSPLTRISFRIGDDDARKLSDGFPHFEARDLQNLGRGEAIMRVERSDYDFNLTVPLLDEPDEAVAVERRETVIAASRAKYSRLRTEIEAAMRQTITAEPTIEKPAPQPKAMAQKTEASVPAVAPRAETPAPVVPPKLEVPAVAPSPEEVTSRSLSGCRALGSHRCSGSWQRWPERCRPCCLLLARPIHRRLAAHCPARTTTST